MVIRDCTFPDVADDGVLKNIQEWIPLLKIYLGSFGCSFETLAEAGIEPRRNSNRANYVETSTYYGAKTTCLYTNMQENEMLGKGQQLNTSEGDAVSFKYKLTTT